MSLTEQEILRYSRHIILPEVGGRGQRKLKSSSILVAGLGAVGSAAALYLAAAGGGRITLWDPARVSPTDLAQAIAHTQERIGTNRADSALVPLQAINPDTRAEALTGPDQLLGAIADHQVVVATQGDWLAIQTVAIRAGAAVVFAGAQGATGAAFTYRTGEPCLGCLEAQQVDALGLHPEGESVVSAVGGLMGVVAATEAIKLVLGTGLPLTGRIFSYDGWEARFREVLATRRTECAVCGGKG